MKFHKVKAFVRGGRAPPALTPYDLMYTYVYFTDFSPFWREALMYTYVYISPCMQHTEQRLYHTTLEVMTEPSGFAAAHGWYL